MKFDLRINKGRIPGLGKLVYLNYEEILDFFKTNTTSWDKSIKTNSKSQLLNILETNFLNKKRDIYFFDEITKFSEMSYLIQKAPYKEPIIDLCCGYAYWISKTLKSIDLGIDLFPKEGPYARTINGFVENKFIDNVYKSVLKANITKQLPLPDNFANTVFSICAFEHIDKSKHTSAFKEINRILKPGGRFIFTVQTKLTLDKITEVFSTKFVNFIHESGFQNNELMNSSYWVRLIDKSGFEIIQKEGHIANDLIILWATSVYPIWYKSWINKLGFSDLVRKNKNLTEIFFRQILPSLCMETDFNKSSLIMFECKKK
ncbi:MAG: methyltransferase type 11 [uncultured bacterium]|nr:MAG: methyltransferase type 11 [uncultured bacterium]